MPRLNVEAWSSEAEGLEMASSTLLALAEREREQQKWVSGEEV